MADGQQQAALGVQHLANVGRHLVYRLRELAQLVRVARVAHRDWRLELAGAEAPRTSTDVADRAQHAVDDHVRQRRERQQRRQREPDHAARLELPLRAGERELDAVAVGRLAHDGAAVGPLVA